MADVPREQINYPGAEYESVPGKPAKLVTPAAPAVHVAWDNQGECLQVGLEFDAGMLREQLDGSPGEERLTFYTEDLGRPATNKMIRTLRRARDASYGRDE